VKVSRADVLPVPGLYFGGGLVIIVEGDVVVVGDGRRGTVDLPEPGIVARASQEQEQRH
jgi:hypothetical protein